MNRRESNAAPWPQRRRSLLDTYFDTLERIHDLEAEDRFEEAVSVRSALAETRDAYVEALPSCPLSRDPYTGDVVEYRIDKVDLDGLWWNYEAPARPVEQPVPATYFALTGAVCLHEPVARAPFLCIPGPEVPYVVPRILDHDAVRAVLSSLAIGPHTGYAVFYFADPIPHALKRVNTWGTGRWRMETEDGSLGWDSVVEDLDDQDFELAPWIEAGKLFWIAPDDEEMTLRDKVTGCPYLDLEGRRRFTRIQDGEVWWPEEIPEWLT